jgi:hypothetical protein
MWSGWIYRTASRVGFYLDSDKPDSLYLALQYNGKNSNWGENRGERLKISNKKSL